MNEVGWFLKYFWGLSYSKSSRSSLCLTHAPCIEDVAGLR
jgi:hypothetical protein